MPEATPMHFSTQWKTFLPFFHTMEKMFSHYGKSVPLPVLPTLNSEP
jgi:hypothetical protein